MADRPAVVAHRGASAYAPENTLAAFERSLALGIADLEFDVRATRDGVPVVIHDQMVDRTTDGAGPVSELTLAELKRLDAGSWFRSEFAGEQVPTLEEVFALLRDRAYFNVEIKDAGRGLEAKALALMTRYGVRGRSSARSFDVSVVEEFAPVAEGGFPSFWLVDRLDARTVDRAVSLGANGVSAHVDGLTVEGVRQARAARFTIGAWGVSSAADIGTCLAFGVDQFTHDRPDEAVAVLERLLGASALRGAQP